MTRIFNQEIYQIQELKQTINQVYKPEKPISSMTK